jgi:ABC-2 type transport system permease protein
MRAFGGDHLWPLVPFAVAFVVLVVLAGALAARRDIGRGLLAERRGHAHAARGLLSPLGLAWRLQRGALIGWAAGMLGFGLVYGAIVDEISTTSGATADWYARMGGSEVIVDAYRASVMEMAGMAVAIYAVQILLRMRADEAEGPLEPILATAVSRQRWMAGHMLNAGLGALALLVVFAVGMATTAGAVLGDVSGQLRDMLQAGLAQLAGIAAIGGIVIAVIALVPRWAAGVSWTLVVVFILLGPLFGAATLQLPGWAQDLSPFTHVPKAPAADVTVAPVLGLLAIAAILVAAAVTAFRRRNLVLPA